MMIAKPIVDGLPIAFGVVMIGAGVTNFLGSQSVLQSFARWGYAANFNRVTGGLEVAAGSLFLNPATSRLGAIGSATILLAAIATLIRYRDWSHLPGAVALTAVATAVVATRK